MIEPIKYVKRKEKRMKTETKKVVKMALNKVRLSRRMIEINQKVKLYRNAAILKTFIRKKDK